MLDRPDASSEQILRETTESWLAAFNAALTGDTPHALAELFVEDSHWRNLLGVSWQFATFSGRDRLADELPARAREVAAAGFRVDAVTLPPRKNVVAAREVIEAIIRFDTDNGPGVGAVRLLPQANGQARAWTFSTALDFNAICETRSGRAQHESHARRRTGSSSARWTPPMRIATPTCSLSAAAMPAFPRRSNSIASASPLW